ncbi:MAG: hypothetical protein ACP5EQ_01785 [Candidatus Cloacimonadia bacterium]
MHFYKKKLRSIRRSYFLAKAGESLFLLFSMLLVIFVCTSFLVLTFQNNYNALHIIVSISKIISTLVAVFFIIQIIRSYPSLHTTAAWLSEQYPQYHEAFLSGLELENEGLNPHYSKEIINATISQADIYARELRSGAIVNKKEIFRPVKIFISIFCVALLSFLITPQTFTLCFAALQDVEQFAPQYESEIYVVPGDTTLLKGSNQTIEIENFYPELTYTLHFEQHRRWETITLAKDNYTFYNIDEDISYYVANEIAGSDTFYIKVLEKPVINSLDISYLYPKYSQLPSKTENNASGNIIALKGTKISLTITVNNELLDYRIVFSDGTTWKLEKVGDFQYTTSFSVEKNGTYHFYLEDILHNTNQPIEYTIYAEEDIPPRIEILAPAKDKILAQSMTEDIEFLATDDFGISEIQIIFKKNDEDYTSRTIQKNINQTTVRSTYTFDLGDQNLLPGDVIFYYLFVSDNCTVPESQKSKSKIYLLKFPSTEELYDEIQKEQDYKYEELSRTLEESEKNKQKFEELRRRFLKQEEFTWEEKEDIKEILQKQEKFAQKADEIAESYKEFIDELEKNRAVSSETLEKLRQVQEIMEDIATPELRETMNKVQEAIEQITPEQMQKALDEFKFSQEEFNRKLDETLDLVKSIQLEQEMQKYLQQAEELEKLQQEINSKTNECIANQKDLQDLSSKQQEIADQYDQLTSELGEFSDRLSQESERQAAEELQQALEELNNAEVSKMLQDASRRISSNNAQNLQSTQNSILQNFKQLKQSIQSAQGMMQMAMQAQIASMIERTLIELLYFSYEQEQILDSKYTAYDIFDKEVAIYEGLKNSVNRLFSVPQMMLMVSPQFSRHTAETLNRFEQMFESIQDRRNYNVQPDKQSIYSSLNIMIIDLLQSQSRMQGGGGGMQTLLQQLQKLSESQGSINLLTQALLEQMVTQMQQAQGLSAQQRQMIERIARDEQRIKENLERILREFPEAEKLLGNLEDVKKDIEEVLSKLDRGIIDEEVIRKQERILSRLLDAQKSVHRRDFSKKREAQTPESQLYEVPDTLHIETQSMQVKDILKIINENYPEEYHRLIKEYLQRIQNEE